MKWVLPVHNSEFVCTAFRLEGPPLASDGSLAASAGYRWEAATQRGELFSPQPHLEKRGERVEDALQREYDTFDTVESAEYIF